jgi:hypothetical protein
VQAHPGAFRLCLLWSFWLRLELWQRLPPVRQQLLPLRLFVRQQLLPLRLFVRQQLLPVRLLVRQQIQREWVQW